jgi:hypothetical protein
MSKRKRQHDESLPTKLQKYATDYALDFHQYSEYHMRLMDGGFVTLDVWTTGRYYVLMTDYLGMLSREQTIIERGGEKGDLPSWREGPLFTWLNKLFFPVDA